MEVTTKMGINTLSYVRLLAIDCLTSFNDESSFLAKLKEVGITMQKELGIGENEFRGLTGSEYLTPEAQKKFDELMSNK